MYAYRIYQKEASFVVHKILFEESEADRLNRPPHATTHTLELARSSLPRTANVRIKPHPLDDPTLMETWM